MPAPTTIQVSYDTDPRWTSIDAYTMSHLHPRSRPNHAVLAQTLEAIKIKGLPDIMNSPPPQAKFFALQCRMLGVKHCLELGTLGGYSAIWLATENPSMTVTTVEFDPHHAEVATANIRAAGVADRVHVILGAGMDVLPKLYEEIEAGEREKFGYTFIDADKLNNYNYFDWAVKMSLPRACICVDNIVGMGRLAMEKEAVNDVMVRGGRECVERVGADDRVEATVLQTVGEKMYDGYVVLLAFNALFGKSGKGGADGCS